MNSRRVTDTFHSRSGGRLISLSGLVVIALGYALTGNPAPAGLKPLLSGWPGAAVALAAVMIVIGLMRLINKAFNIMRQESSLGGIVMVSVAAAFPWLPTTLWSGWLMPVVLLGASYMLFSTFGGFDTSRTIFAIFCLLTASAFVVPQILYFLPVVLIGCMQMRIFSLRCCLAALFGIVTPPWIAVGFGLCSVSELPLPPMEIAPYEELLAPENAEFIVAVGLSILVGVVMLVGNLYKLLSYNAMTRATNGFMALLFLAVTVLCVADAAHLSLYLPLLVTLVSYQVTLFFVTRASERSWIGIVITLSLFWGLFIWNIWNVFPADLF